MSLFGVQRKHEIVAGDPPNNAEELAFLIVHHVDSFIFLSAEPNYTEALGAIELAKHIILRRKK